MTSTSDTIQRLQPGKNIGAYGRPRLEVEEKLRSAIYAVMDDETMEKWVASMKKKLRNGDQWATQFFVERIQGKVPDRLEHAGVMRIVVEYISDDKHDAPADDVVDAD